MLQSDWLSHRTLNNLSSTKQKRFPVSLRNIYKKQMDNQILEKLLKIETFTVSLIKNSKLLKKLMRTRTKNGEFKIKIRSTRSL